MFPGANESHTDATYTIVGAPLERSTTFRGGTRFGPDRIRKFARPFEDYDHHRDIHFSECAVHDHGDIRAWDDVSAYLQWLEGELRDVAQTAIPLLLGGEHTVTRSGVRAVEPTVVVCADAHLDLRATFDGNSDSHATVMHHILDVPSVEEILLVGTRTGSAAEWERTQTSEVTVISPSAFEPDQIEQWVQSRACYLSIDIDAADIGIAPGTGTPEPFGLHTTQLRDLVRTVAPTTVGFDIVEINDRDNGQAASLGAKLLREYVFAHTAATDVAQD